MTKQKKTRTGKDVLVPYSKGLEMTPAMLRNPGKFTNRVVVAYDKEKQTKPRVYVLIGNHDHTNEHQIRRAYQLFEQPCDSLQDLCALSARRQEHLRASAQREVLTKKIQKRECSAQCGGALF